jgi:hypothetical protein
MKKYKITMRLSNTQSRHLITNSLAQNTCHTLENSDIAKVSNLRTFRLFRGYAWFMRSKGGTKQKFGTGVLPDY